MDNAIAKIRTEYKKDLPEDLVGLAEERAVNNLLKEASLNEEGKLVFLDAAKAPRVDPKTLKVLDAETLLREQLKSLIDAGRQQGGAGSQGGKGGSEGGKGGESKFVSVPGHVKTQSQLVDYL
jgi:hypothetical protein